MFELEDYSSGIHEGFFSKYAVSWNKKGELSENNNFSRTFRRPATRTHTLACAETQTGAIFEFNVRSPRSPHPNCSHTDMKSKTHHQEQFGGETLVPLAISLAPAAKYSPPRSLQSCVVDSPIRPRRV